MIKFDMNILRLVKPPCAMFYKLCGEAVRRFFDIIMSVLLQIS